MFVPFMTSRSRYKGLERRKGGGGGGRSSAGKSGGSTSSSGKTLSSSGSGEMTSVSLSTSANGRGSATAYGSGGGRSIVIPSGQPFSGRSAGGGTRDQIFGTRTYGSGYPGDTGRGVAGRGFPFWFWPVVWGVDGIPSSSYLRSTEYGNLTNTSRVGGPMAEAIFISSNTNSTFHVLCDNSTASSLISSIDANCSSSLSPSSSTSPLACNASGLGGPQPEQAVQYYRASSIVLTLDGYNNSATYNNNSNAPDSPLPSGIDTTLLDCLNQTIGLSSVLISDASLRWSNPCSASLVCIVWFVWWMLSL